MQYLLPNLPYSYDALEPYIDARTVEIHYSKHHQTYVNNLNKVLAGYPVLDKTYKSLEEILKSPDKAPFSEKDKIFFRNNAGGAMNHSLYWEIMGPQKQINEQLAQELRKVFGSLEEFKKLFTNTAVSHFGSGWAWLSRDESNKLKVYSLPNQDSPLSMNHIPLIALDLWEHAYYLKYRNRRPEYIENWWNVLRLLP